METETPKPQGAPVVRARIIEDNERNVWGDYVGFYLGIVNPQGQTHYALPVQFDPEPDNRHGETLLVCHKCPEGRAFLQSLFEDLWGMGIRPNRPGQRLQPPPPQVASLPGDAGARIKQAKEWRMRLDEILQEMKAEQREYAKEVGHPAGRHLALSVTHLEDCIMRQGMVLKELADTSPYPESYNPASPVVEPVADGLKM